MLPAAGSWAPEANAHGWRSVRRPREDMDENRRRRPARLGFPDDEAVALSASHTRNLM